MPRVSGQVDCVLEEFQVDWKHAGEDGGDWSKQGQGALPPGSSPGQALGTKLGRTLRTRFVWVWKGAYRADTKS